MLALRNTGPGGRTGLGENDFIGRGSRLSSGPENGWLNRCSPLQVLPGNNPRWILCTSISGTEVVDAASTPMTIEVKPNAISTVLA